MRSFSQFPLSFRRRCGSPASHEHQPMLDVPSDLFTCPDMHYAREQSNAYRTGVLVVGALSISAILLSAILLVKRKQLYNRFLSRKNRNGSVYYVKAHTNPVDGYEPNA